MSGWQNAYRGAQFRGAQSPLSHASQALRTISTFSSDIAHAVFRFCPAPSGSLERLPRAAARFHAGEQSAARYLAVLPSREGRSAGEPGGISLKVPLWTRSGGSHGKELLRPGNRLQCAHATPRLLRRLFTGVILGSALLLTASPADGDVGVVGVRPTVGAPGQSVKVDAGCGGPCPPRLPISLVPLARAPTPQPCHAGKAVCSPEAAEPPREPPYVFLGWAKQDSASSAVAYYRLRFRVPRITPGVYAFVIFCSGCAPGRRGALVVTTRQPGNLLRVRSEQNQVASQGSGTDALWFIAAAAGLAAIAGGAVFLRRRRAR
jgi:hypothetical protein